MSTVSLYVQSCILQDVPRRILINLGRGFANTSAGPPAIQHIFTLILLDKIKIETQKHVMSFSLRAFELSSSQLHHNLHLTSLTSNLTHILWECNHLQSLYPIQNVARNLNVLITFKCFYKLVVLVMLDKRDINAFNRLIFLFQ